MFLKEILGPPYLILVYLNFNHDYWLYQKFSIHIQSSAASKGKELITYVHYFFKLLSGKLV